MNTSDQIIYAGCWVVLLFYIITTLLVFIRGSCVSCAASFLFACVLSFDMALFNTWFLLPAFSYHVRELALLHARSWPEYVRLVLTGEAARDVFLVLLGTFGSWLAIFNAASMLQTEGCVAASPHDHGPFARYFIRSVYRTCDYLRIGNVEQDEEGLPAPVLVDKATCFMSEKDYYPSEKDRLLGN